MRLYRKPGLKCFSRKKDIEMLIIEISFEMVREGAIRVPGVIGQTLGIVGALILRQASASANLVSPIMVIVVSLTAIGSFSLSM